MGEICAFHGLPSPLHDEKLPVGMGSNPVRFMLKIVLGNFVSLMNKYSSADILTFDMQLCLKGKRRTLSYHIGVYTKIYFATKTFVLYLFIITIPIIFSGVSGVGVINSTNIST